MLRFASSALTLCCALHVTHARAQDATTAGEVMTPHPTLEHISIDWAIDGDDDEDGVVTVRFREQGSDSWRQGHPLFRVPAGSHDTGFSWANRHSGSLFGLVPGTTYEIELTLADPDGGDDVRMVTATTRPVPMLAPDATEIPVTPDTFPGALASAGPGDVLVLAAGTYASFTVANDGSEGSPIVVRGADAATVIVDGEVRMDGRSDVWLMDLTVRGQVKFNNAARIVVQGCRIETDGDGIISYADGTSDGYFADNTIIGSTIWSEAALGESGDNVGEGIAVTGPGNVIAYNRVERFRDCVSLLEDSGANEQVSIDIIGNDLHQCADDAIEADFAMGNVRVLRNRSTTSFIAWSSQPGLGGPTWFVRNVAFGNAFQVFKPHRHSLGDVLYHNTVVKQGDALGVYTGDEWGRTTTRNNIFIGGPEATELNGYSTGQGRILQVAALDTTHASFDYDGFGSELDRFDGRFGATSFADFAELRAMTSEANAVQLGVSTFAESFTFPSTITPVEAPDLRLAEGSPAVDSGLALPNINDGFAGAGPDLGAYELGSALPPYGPRTAGSVCGNGVVETGEECDDGGTADGDGCSATCRSETPGTDGGVTSDGGGAPSDGGTSDDGGSDSGDGGCGCSMTSAPGSALPLLLVGLLSRRRSRSAPRS